MDLDGNRQESEEYNDIKSFRSYIEKNKDNVKIVELLDCDPLNILYDWSTYSGLLKDCKNLVEVKDVVGTSNIKDMRYMFKGCSKLESVPYFDTSSVENMINMFSGCSNLESVPYFDTSSVENMYGMFMACSNLKSVPLFNTSKVENMGFMFEDCSNLKEVPSFDTSSVEDMFCMFKGCPEVLDYIKSMKGSKVHPRISEMYNYVWSKVE